MTYEFTPHVNKRMKQRNISRGDIMLCIHTGIQMQNKHHEDRWTYKCVNRKDFYVVVEKETNIIKTAFFGRSVNGYKD